MGARILVVEDEPAVSQLIVLALEAAGHVVFAFDHPADALGTTELVDLLLTDVSLPGMTGPALAERLCARRADLKVLFISGHGEAAIADTQHLGHRLLPKPFTPTGLVRAVEDALRRSAP
jgi:two-component system cell cycle sensor histidine kinase/response regulator CckA